MQRVAQARGPHAVGRPPTASRVSEVPGPTVEGVGGRPVEGTPRQAAPADGLARSRCRPSGPVRPGPAGRPSRWSRRSPPPLTTTILSATAELRSVEGQLGVGRVLVAGCRSTAMPAARRRASASGVTESRSPTTRSTASPRASAWSSPESAAIDEAAVRQARRRGAAGAADQPPVTMTQRAGICVPPLALPRSGSRVGGGDHPLSPPCPPGSPLSSSGGYGRPRRTRGTRRARGTSKRATGTTRRTRDLDAVDRPRQLGHRQLGVELDLGRHEQLVGAEVLGAHVDERVRRRSATVDRRRRSAAASSGVADSPMSRPFISTRQHDGDGHEQQADGDRCRAASQRGSPVTWASTTPNSAKSRPIAAPTSSSSTTGSSGCLASGG